jgi:hypothetical protein
MILAAKKDSSPFNATNRHQATKSICWSMTRIFTTSGKKIPPVLWNSRCPKTSTRVNLDRSMGAERQVYPRTENQTMNKNVEMKHAAFVWVEFRIGDPKQDNSRKQMIRPATNTANLYANVTKKYIYFRKDRFADKWLIILV